MRRIRLILAAALAAVFLGTALAYWLNPPVKMPLTDAGDNNFVDEDGRPRVRGLTYTQVENGVRKWTLSAQGARFDEAHAQAVLTKVRVVFYPEKGGWVTLTGDEGEYDQKSRRVILRGNVRGRTSDNMTLNTQALTYSDETREVDTDSMVTVAGDRFKVRGRGMRVNLARNTLVFKSEVESTFIPEGKGPPPGATIEDG